MNDQLPDDVRGRIEAAAEAADEAFWTVIAERFPEVKSGDVDPGFVFRRGQQNEQDVESFLIGNYPDDGGYAADVARAKAEGYEWN